MKWTHRKRIIVAAVGLSLCAQILMVGMGILNAGRVDEDIEASSRLKMLDSASYNITTYLSHINSMLNYLQSNELSEYVRSFLALEDPAIAKQKTEEVNLLLKQIRFSDNLIDKVYILGNYSFQKNIVIHQGQNDMSEEYTPNISDLASAQLLPILQYYRNHPTVFAAGELTDRLKFSASMLPEQKTAVKQLAQDLEGRVVLNGGVIDGNPKSFMVILVMKKDLLSHLVESDSFTSFALMDNNQKLIDQTPPLKGTKMISQMKTINSSGLKLEMFSQRKMESMANKQAFLIKYMLFFMIILVVTFLITFIYSHYLILPFRKISHRMNKQHLLFPLQFLDKEKVSKGGIPTLSLRKKLIILFSLSVCIPAVSSAFAYYQFINAYSKQQMKPYAEQFAQQVNKNVHRQAIIYEDLISKLTLNPTFVSLLIYQNFNNLNMKQEPDISFLQYSGISDVSYFVLYNLLGTQTYSNQNSDFLNYFSLDTNIRKEIDSSNTIVWSTNMKDLYNQPTVSLIKQIFDAAGPTPKPIGYIQIVLNQSAFQAVLPDKNDYLLALNAAGNVLFQNEPTKKAFKEVMQTREEVLAHEGNPLQYAVINGVEGIANVHTIEGMNWNTFLLESMESLLTEQKKLSLSYLIVIFSTIVIAMIFAYGLTKWLIRSLEHLKLAMEQQIVEVKMDKRIVYKDRDEISDLIDSYNRMMAQINQLMVENIQIAQENSLNQMKQQELLSLKTQAELKMLQLQINPHFLYNTLQSIGMRAKRAGEEEVGFMVYALADLFRYSISHDSNFVDLSDEIEHTRNYIAIQEFRFKDKFTVEWDVSEEALQCKVIKFALQPLVENAISHGILSSIREGKIWIKAFVDQEMLSITIADNGVGIEEGRLISILDQWQLGNSQRSGRSNGESKGGLGLNNVFFRLQLIYNGRGTMTIQSETFEGTTIQLRIPQDV
ncbi:sensor histidine kinase [Paenibacillus eucommiae]|uniref:histidine kinase n=1 Tax=Paenibacillus eucommiae TaxID=1355755 RepID=A0ABS4IZH5_9BACL|nr:sensor histidine kinase [Paenibacillus eucommiae]MBP1992987.1 sensor histidine kinase YesM [Paenibacillus eucommiae]